MKNTTKSFIYWSLLTRQMGKNWASYLPLCTHHTENWYLWKR